MGFIIKIIFLYFLFYIVIRAVYFFVNSIFLDKGKIYRNNKNSSNKRKIIDAEFEDIEQ